MNIFLWVIFGGLAGWIGSLIVGADDTMGLLSNVVVGIIGAFLGGWIADRMGWGGAEGADRPTTLISFATAVVGAVVLLIILNLIM